MGSASLLASDEAFKRIIDDETVPEGIPWATPHEELKNRRKAKVPAKVKSIRGKLNVPRERSTCAPRPNISGRASNSAIEGGCEDRMDSSLFWGRLGLPIVAVTLGANEAVDSSG